MARHQKPVRPEETEMSSEALFPNVTEAIRLLGVYTAGTFNVWDLSGSQKTSCRAHIMSHLFKGNNRPGVTHLQKLLFRTANIQPRRREQDYEAEERFIQWCRQFQEQKESCHVHEVECR